MALNPPQTFARTSHAITIKAASGAVVGMIKQWNPSITRDINPIYELNAATSGDPVENIPGNIKNLTIKVGRYDLYTVKMEEAFGNTNLIWLSNQDRPFSVIETWKNPDNSTEAYKYDGCWFSQIGRNLSSDDQRFVLADATLVYLRKFKI